MAKNVWGPTGKERASTILVGEPKVGKVNTSKEVNAGPGKSPAGRGKGYTKTFGKGK